MTTASALGIGETLTRRTRRAGVERSIPRERFFHRELMRLIARQVRPGARVLQVGCSLTQLLRRLSAAEGMGLDFRASVAAAAREACPEFDFRLADPVNPFIQEQAPGRIFDYVVVSDVLGELQDVQAALEALRPACARHTRIVLTYYSALWEPVLKAASWLGLRRRAPEQNWLTSHDMANVLALAGYEVVRLSHEMLLPVRAPLVTGLANRVLARLWPFKHLALTRVMVARPMPFPELRTSACAIVPGQSASQIVRGEQPVGSGPRRTADRAAPSLSCSVIIPTRNERGNVAAAVARVPSMGRHTEMIFVDGDSTDGTVEEIRRAIAAHPEKDIRLIEQGEGRGKGDAVRKGFAAAKGDILMILDADLTVSPEELPKFFRCLASGHAEFANGTRLVYPMERDAMRLLNKGANWFFGELFTWLLGQRFRDTLCGTKVLRREDYERIAADRAVFAPLDPFGDFELIFGAARGNLKIVDIPIRYRARTYGLSNIRRFFHGLLLLRMSWVALWKLKLR